MSQLSRCKLTRVRKTVVETVWKDVLTTICRSEDLTVPPLVGCCRWNPSWYSRSRPIQEEKEWTTQSTDQTLVYLTGIAPREFRQTPSSPDVSLASTSIITSCSWQTLSTLSSDHLQILIRLQIKTTSTPGLRRTYVNLKKADWDRYRQEVETALSKRSLPTDCQRKEMRRSSVQFYSKQRHTKSLLDDTDSTRNLYQQRYWM